ncbi:MULTISPECIES: hypothetical protein [Vibrio]|uniref:hypothetical protein n=1 Tax=Vibrio TaxID=662 RepID=UPI003D0D582E
MSRISLLLSVLVMSLSFNTSAQSESNGQLPCIKDGYFLGTMSEASCKDVEGLTVENWTDY